MGGPRCWSTKTALLQPRSRGLALAYSWYTVHTVQPAVGTWGTASLSVASCLPGLAVLASCGGSPESWHRRLRRRLTLRGTHPWCFASREWRRVGSPDTIQMLREVGSCSWQLAETVPPFDKVFVPLSLSTPCLTRVCFLNLTARGVLGVMSSVFPGSPSQLTLNISPPVNSGLPNPQLASSYLPLTQLPPTKML